MADINPSNSAPTLPGLNGMPTVDTPAVSTEENLEIEKLLLTNIIDGLESGDKDQVTKSLESLQNLDEIIDTVSATAKDTGKDVADILLKEIAIPLVKMLEEYPQLSMIIQNLLNRIFDGLLAQNINGRRLSFYIMDLSNEIEILPPSEFRTFIVNQVSSKVIDFCIANSNLHDIIVIANNQAPTIAQNICIQLPQSRGLGKFEKFEKSRVDRFFSDFVNVLPMLVKDDKALIELIVFLKSEGLLDVFKINPSQFPISQRFDFDGQTEGILGKSWQNFFSRLQQSPELDNLIAALGFELYLQLYQPEMVFNLDGSGDVLGSILIIEEILTKHKDQLPEELVAKYATFIIRAAIKQREVSAELIQLQLKSISILKVIKELPIDVVSEDQMSDLKKVLILEVSNEIKKGKKEYSVVKPVVDLILPPGFDELFTTEDRVQILGIIVTQSLTVNSASYLRDVLTYVTLNESENNYRTVFEDGYVFSENPDAKSIVVEEIRKVMQDKTIVSLDLKKAFIDDVIEGGVKGFPNGRTKDLLIQLFLTDDEVLEYFRTKELEAAEKQQGNSLSREFLEIRTLILDSLNQQSVEERVRNGKDGKFKQRQIIASIRIQYLSWGKGAERSRLELSRSVVEKETKQELDSGIKKLYEILKNKPEILSKELNSDPDVYSVLVESIEELYQYSQNLEAAHPHRIQIERILNLVLNNNQVLRLMPTRIQRIQIDLWKSALDNTSEALEGYGQQKSDILKVDGVEINLESLNGRKKRKYERKLTKVLDGISTPRGQCLAQIVTLYNSPDKFAFKTFSSLPEFQAILEYAIDQYSARPESFVALSESEKAFLNFLIFNNDIWGGLESRIKYKLSMMLYSSWSTQDPAGQEILEDLVELKEGAVSDYDFKYADQINIIGASYRYVTPGVKDPMVKFVRTYFDESGKNKRRRDRLISSNNLRYANNLNYLVSYVVSSNRLTSKEFFVAVDQVIADKAVWEDQSAADQASLDLGREVDKASENINPEGVMLTPERSGELETQLESNLNTILVFITAFDKTQPPLPYRTAVELSKSLPKIMDIVMHTMYAYKSEFKANLNQIIAFLTKVTAVEPEPAYFMYTSNLVEVLEDLNDRSSIYLKRNSPVEGLPDAELKAEVKKMLLQIETLPVEVVGKATLGEMDDLFSSVDIETKADGTVVVERVLSESYLLRSLKPLSDLYMNKFDTLLKLDKKAIEVQVETTLAILLVYLSIYATNPRISKFILGIISKMVKLLENDEKRQGVYAEFINLSPTLFRKPRFNKARILPAAHKQQVQTYFNVKAA